jgi:glycosyltransferase involved in cell wall biosynthesis
MIRFSVVVPARNEEKYLPRLLDSLETAVARYRRGPEAIERIVADNVSTDATAEIARARGWRVVPVEKRVIGAVRNGGAREASGEVLAFVDADARVHPDTFDALDDALATGRVVGGATGVRLERMSLGLALTYAVLMPFVWTMRMDTGLTFCRRDDFLAIGGYDESLRFAEDLKLLFDLRRLGKPRGQRLARVTRAKAVASTRKFDRFGDWHYFPMMARAASWYARSPASLERFADRYWYGDER